MYDPRTHAAPCIDITNTLGEFELFVAYETDTRAQKLKTLKFDFRPDLNLAHDFNLGDVKDGLRACRSEFLDIASLISLRR